MTDFLSLPQRIAVWYTLEKPRQLPTVHIFPLLLLLLLLLFGTAVVQWLRCCATKRKVAGSIPAGVIGIFH